MHVNYDGKSSQLRRLPYSLLTFAKILFLRFRGTASKCDPGKGTIALRMDSNMIGCASLYESEDHV